MFKILVTRPLSGRQIQFARILDLEPVISPALTFKFPEYWDKVLKTINDHPKAGWVFTSSNSVKALEALMKKGFQINPQRTIYAVGSRTQKVLRKLGHDAIIPHTYDGAHLADKIIDEREREILYFHGSLSRSEMTDKLVENGISVTEKEVYETVIHPVNMPAVALDAILFYSPSAVEGFKQGSGFNEKLPPLFAIGPTTAEALKINTNQKIITASKADTKVILRTVSDYLAQME